MAIGALWATSLACILTMIQIPLDVQYNHVDCNRTFSNSTFQPIFPSPTFGSYMGAFGSLMFAFGGASIFPTVQVDMQDRTR